MGIHLGEPVKAVMLSTQRCGTTLMLLMLAQHPEVLSIGEVFKHNNNILKPEFWYDGRQRFEKHLNRLYKQSEFRAVLFKLMYDQLQKRPQIKDYLCQSGVRCILVRRKNILKTYLSLERAKQNNLWTMRATSARTVAPIRVETRKLLPGLDKLAHINSRLETIAAEIGKVLDVEYEEFVADKKCSIGKMADFLGVSKENFNPKPVLKKISPESISESVTNYNEVLVALSSSKYFFLVE